MIFKKTIAHSHCIVQFPSRGRMVDFDLWLHKLQRQLVHGQPCWKYAWHLGHPLLHVCDHWQYWCVKTPNSCNSFYFIHMSERIETLMICLKGVMEERLSLPMSKLQTQ